jgi:hypothetical protein
VLFWICIHYDRLNKEKTVPRFKKWNYGDVEELVRLKKGEVDYERDFIIAIEHNFTSYY